MARTSSLRYDGLQERWVIVASHRQGRSFLPADEDCPLCPITAGHRTDLPGSEHEVVVFDNGYSALGGAGGLPDSPGASVLLGEVPAAGRCEVICYTADHNANFAQLSEERVALVLEALVDRTRALGARDDVEQVFCFENRGREIGVTQSHPHGQIYAYPFVAPRLAQSIAATRRHRAATGTMTC